jgi:hypothetical protein
MLIYALCIENYMLTFMCDASCLNYALCIEKLHVDMCVMLRA